MKKGFSNFDPGNFNSLNPQTNRDSTNHNNQQNIQNITNQQKPTSKDKTEIQQNGFSIVNKATDLHLNSTDPNLNRTTYQNSSFSMNPGMSNCLGNNVMQNGRFGNYSMINLESPQYFQNAMPSFSESPYAMLFNQFQNHPSLNSSQASSQAMIITLFQIIQTQAKSLQSLYGKVEKMTQKIHEFGQKMKEIKKIKKQPTPEEQDLKPVIEHISQSMENIDSKTLIKILFGSNKIYNYKLELNQFLQLPLYRERNFSISLKLTDNEGKIVKNNNKIPLSLAIYSSQNPPKFIEKNTAGQKILKGYIQQSLHHGQCRFEKIQIKEVTSHFRNGWVFIVIIPCMTPLGSANPNDSFIDYLKIQPLVLEKVVVKAKKIKDTGKKGKEEKDQSQMADVKDSEHGMVSEKIESKQKNKTEKVKAEQNEEPSEDIYEDK